MKYTVRVHLKSGKEIVFGSDLSTPIEIKSSILNGQLNDPWYYFKNANGEGYFLKGDVVAIEIKKDKL